MSFSPISAARNISEKYLRYLKTIFKISDVHYQKQLEHYLTHDEQFSNGPYLDVNQNFIKSKTIRELVKEGTLVQGMLNLNFKKDRPLYAHQIEALSLIQQNRNMVVSTGTGSGKTESFLIPILNSLMKEYERGTLSSGVRALIIYPLNALANDQTNRMRSILENFSKITFGTYTGQTENLHKDALKAYHDLHHREPLVNELISREQMITNPPQILITNYAMLEFLMIRPKENVFFLNPHTWKFVVLDEAHIYSGSTGIEVSMLLRRLQATLQSTKLQFILTSATLGSPQDNADVASFASDLTNVPFSEKDVVRAQRQPIQWGTASYRLPISLYKEMAQTFADDQPEIRLNTLLAPYHFIVTSPWRETLYKLVLNDQNYYHFRSLVNDAMSVHQLCGNLHWTEEELFYFIEVTSHCEMDGDKLIDGRYHMFLRAPESAFVTLAPTKKLFMRPQKIYYEGDTSYKIFEIATCSHCHIVYLVGKINKNTNIFEQNSSRDDLTDRTFLLLQDQLNLSEDDESDENEIHEPYLICSHCGALKKRGSNQHFCLHDPASFIPVIRIKQNNSDEPLKKCPSCNASTPYGILRTFFSGQEATTSVLGTALFQELPSQVVELQPTKPTVEDADWGDESGATQTYVIREEAKQFLAFSDNRQGAAYYTTYLRTSYQQFLYRRLINYTLQKLPNSQPLSLDMFHRYLTSEFKAVIIQKQNCDIEAWKGLFSELTDPSENTTLSGLGLFAITLNEEHFSEHKTYQLSRKEVRDMATVFIQSMLFNVAVELPPILNENDRSFFMYGNFPGSYTLSDSSILSKVYSFIPKRAHSTNRRYDYLKRVLSQKGFDLPDEKLRGLLKAFWDKFISPHLMTFVKVGFMLKREEILINSNPHWYQCTKCRHLTSINVANTCPEYQCDGTLQAVNPTQLFFDHHYWEMYHQMPIRGLRVEEHTAQLDHKTAYQFQKDFEQKKIDVLSCSTTFEMGVDVGTLETVFMRNMPPSPSNYVQRSGRAGRSKNAAAFSLTFATKGNHDFYYFNHPTEMIRGNIKPPRFNVENDKIALRHIFASAFAFFWRKDPLFFDDTKMLFSSENGLDSGFQSLVKYLQSRPDNLKHFLLSFLPPSLSQKFGVGGFMWVDALIGNDGLLTQAAKLYQYEIETLKKARDEARSNNKPSDYLQKRINAYEKEEILSFLSRKNVLPKYGFPVDVVELTTTSLGVELQRDLSMAISEYAPGSEVVANGNLFTSRYIKTIPSIGWKMYDYQICQSCQTLHIEIFTDKEGVNRPKQCSRCGVELESSQWNTFIIPEQGFTIDANQIKVPTLKKPSKTYRSDVYFVKYTSEIMLKKHQINSLEIEMGYSHQGELAQINGSHFFTCDSCGYSELDEDNFLHSSEKQHQTSSGKKCSNKMLYRRSLGYRFYTDVVEIKFLNRSLKDEKEARSLLYAILRGMSVSLNIDNNDIQGVLQQYYGPNSMGISRYSLLIYDRTPGGSGHVKRLLDPAIFQFVFDMTFNLVDQCQCGGQEKETSCYSCLRSYNNQKYHDDLKRSYVLNFLHTQTDQISDPVVMK